MASLSALAPLFLLLGSTVSAAVLDSRADPVTYITMAVGDIQSLQSPDFPQNYPANVRSQWEYTCPTEASNVLLLECSVFDLEPSTDCIWDRLIVTYRGSRELKCGSDSPDGTHTATGWMRLTFFSNANNVQGQGFNCNISCMASPTPTACGNHSLTAGQVMAIQTTNYPLPYAVNERCQWEFSCPTETNHTLTFDCPTFELESFANCVNDRLIVTSRSSRDVKCGTDSPDGTVTSTGWTRLTYFSNAQTVNKGFRCYIKCV